MEFAFTAEQEFLRQEARAFLSERFPAERIAEIADSEAHWDPESWREFAELGWLGVSVPEEAGGAGLTFLEEAVLFEEFGRVLYPGPYFSTIALALPALPADLAAEVTAGEARWSAEVGGFVPDLGAVDWVLVAGGAVRAVGEVMPTIDSTRPLGRLSRTGLERRHVDGKLDRPRAVAALALEAVGVAQAALDLGVEYAKVRQQFGKPIGVNQAISHKLADTYVELELARSLAYQAAWRISVGDSSATVAAVAAKAYAAEAAISACERVIQVHGGTGFTWEHSLHRYYKRALWIQSFLGSTATLHAEVALELRRGLLTRPSEGPDPARASVPQLSEVRP